MANLITALPSERPVSAPLSVKTVKVKDGFEASGTAAGKQYTAKGPTERIAMLNLKKQVTDNRATFVQTRGKQK